MNTLIVVFSYLIHVVQLLMFVQNNYKYYPLGIDSGLIFLHRHHIIHRDLKPENILLKNGPNGEVNIHVHVHVYVYCSSFYLRNNCWCNFVLTDCI